MLRSRRAQVVVFAAVTLLLSAAHQLPIAVAGGVVYVGTQNGVEAFAAAGCGSASCAPLTIVPTTPRVLYVVVSNGKLLAVSGGQSDSDPYRLTAFAPTA